MNTKSWNIWINIGEAIVDGIAIGAKGELRRINVPGNGKLRGIVKRQINANLFEIEQTWGVNEDLFSDYYFSLLNNPPQNIRVLSFDAGKSYLKLKGETSRINAGNEFEIFTNEKAETLAIRILTKTLLKNEFPQPEMQLSFIKNVNSLYPLLITSSGFTKNSTTGTQNCDLLFNLNMVKIHSVFDVVIGIEEEIDGRGNVLIELKENKINNLLRKVFKSKPGLVVIALKNASKNPLHEKTIFNLLKTAGIKHVFASHLIC